MAEPGAPGPLALRADPRDHIIPPTPVACNQLAAAGSPLTSVAAKAFSTHTSIRKSVPVKP